LLKEGYILDFISQTEIKSTPEELEAVQVFSKILVEDYGYPKECIQTRPQFRVKGSPSDNSYKYPLDITIFKTKEKKRGEEFIVVECKKETREDGIGQLKDYLKFCEAELGVWFNGNSTQYIRKYIKNGKYHFDEELINIPKYGQRLEDIGLFKKNDLIPTHNLKPKFVSIRNYLAGNAVGTTRDEELARQIINIILCKLYDEKFTKSTDILQFRAGLTEKSSDVSKRIKKRFDEAKTIYKDILDDNETIDLDDKSLKYVVGELQNYSLISAKRDVVGDAFEIFIHRALKGGQGQYFTPKNVVKTAIEILDPDVEDKIIDPACGSGGFLIEGLKYLHKKIEKKGKDYDWPENEIEAEKIAKSNINFRGIEKDSFLSKVVKAYMVIMGDGKSGIFCQDSLDLPKNWQTKTQSNIQLGTFDILLANPPFGAKIPVKGESKLSQYALGHKWKFDKKNKTWSKGKVKDKEAPQVLFIDRCLDLVREGGKLALVLPDGILSNPSDGYIVQHLMNNSEILGMIDLPMSTFLPYTPTKCHLIFLKKTDSPREDYELFMSYAKTCGHDKRGREINEDEIQLIPMHLKNLDLKAEHNHLGWKMKLSEIKDNILLPKYYNPDIKAELNDYEKTGKFKVQTLKELQEKGIIEISRGNEVGSENYGTGTIPFVRTSEVANWEITADCTHCLSEEVFNIYKKKQNIEFEDILVVNDGTYLMGRTAMVTKADLRIVIQSHLRRIKVLNKEKLSPYLLLAMLGLEVVQKQMESKAFRQGTISTLGSRISEVKIPIPLDINLKSEIIENVSEIIKQKEKAKLYAQDYKLLDRTENLMGIKNKAKIGNL
jgi:type I restriction enzyme M protein